MDHIVHVTTVHRPFDTRIFQKECRILVQSGYRVTLIAPHKVRETVNGVTIQPISRFGSRLSRLTRFTWGAWNVYRLACKLHADLYHFHDPELLPIGLLLKLTTSARVIYDVHEDFPENMRSKEWLPSPVRRLASRGVGGFENLAARYLDGLVTATEYIAKRFSAAKRVVAVRNYPLLSAIQMVATTPRAYDDNYTLIYTGGLTNYRGALQIVQAMTNVRPSQANLVILGGYTDAEAAQAARASPGWRSVDYKGQVPYEEMWLHLQSAAVGLVCNQPVFGYDRALPNKLFEYMAAGLPVVASNFPLWRAIIEEHHCGMTVDSTSPERIAEAINYLLAHPELRRTMGENAQRAVAEIYNWEREVAKLLQLYKELLGGA